MDVQNLSWHITVETSRTKKVISARSYPAQVPPLISDDAITSIGFYFNIMLLVCLFGLGANTVNLLVFTKSKAKDSMSIGLTALSATDLLSCVVTLGWRLCFLAASLYKDTLVDLAAIRVVVFGWTQDTLYLMTGSITMFLAVERCACVVAPFNRFFSRGRTFVILIMIYTVHITCFIPVIVSHGLVWHETAETVLNVTITNRRFSFYYTANRKQIEAGMDIVYGSVFPIPYHIVIVVSAIWMTIGLHRSSRVRINTGLTDDQRKTPALSKKETKLVKVVIALAVIQCICTIPRTMAILASLISTEVTHDGRERNLYSLLWGLAFIGMTINSSVNIFVYLFTNSTYKTILRLLIGIK